jgi:large subunit ribosomal protein L25
METMKVDATRREGTRKGPARRLRAAGLIPAVAYGKEQSTTHLAVSPKDVHAILDSEFGRNTVIELGLGEEKRTVLLCDYQYHPVSRELLHADFRQIHLDRPVRVEVPFNLTGRAKGIVSGGVLKQVYHRLPVSCLPTLIPARIEHDITELDVDEHVSASDLSVPEGVTVLLPPTQTVAAVGTVKEVAAEEEAAAAVEGEGEAEKAAEEGAAEHPSSGAGTEAEAKPEK